jgi:hypothetical protein
MEHLELSARSQRRHIIHLGLLDIELLELSARSQRRHMCRIKNLIRVCSKFGQFLHKIQKLACHVSTLSFGHVHSKSTTVAELVVGASQLIQTWALIAVSQCMLSSKNLSTEIVSKGF